MRGWGLVQLLFSLTPGDMDDAGMYTWAGILTVLGLVASYFVAIGWQRWREKRK